MSDTSKGTTTGLILRYCYLTVIRYGLYSLSAAKIPVSRGLLLLSPVQEQKSSNKHDSKLESRRWVVPLYYGTLQSTYIRTDGDMVSHKTLATPTRTVHIRGWLSSIHDSV